MFKECNNCNGRCFLCVLGGGDEGLGVLWVEMIMPFLCGMGVEFHVSMLFWCYNSKVS